MKLLITSLLFFTGLNQVLARSLPWIRHNLDVQDGWMDEDYDLFHLPSSQRNDDFYKFMMDGSLEESKELERSAETKLQGSFIGALLGSFLGNDEEDTTKSEENTQLISNAQRENDDDNNEKILNIFLDEIFGADEDKSSVEKTSFVANEDKSSEETKTFNGENDKDIEDSDEVKPIFEADIFDLTKSSEEKSDNNEGEAVFNIRVADKSEEKSIEATEINDMTKTTEEHKIDVADDLSEADVNQVASFLIALNILNGMDAFIQPTETKDNFVRAREVDGILQVFGAVLDKMIEEEAVLERTSSKKATDDKIIETITDKTESDEEDDSNELTTTTTTTTTTAIPINDSNENEEEDNKSNSSESDAEFVYVVLNGGEGEQKTLDEHKYSVIDAKQEFKPTSAPYYPNSYSDAPSTSRAQNSINEYMVIRENLDTQQDSLKKQELDLDKDFYTIVSNDFDDNSLNKFESDIYTAQENLHRIKKSINAMQNLQTKLYFHKLVTSAIQEAQNKPKY